MKPAELIIRRNTVSANGDNGPERPHQAARSRQHRRRQRRRRHPPHRLAGGQDRGQHRRSQRRRRPCKIDCSSGDKCGKGVTIVENTVTANAADGIQAVKGTDITMVRNVVNGNGSDGILLNGANDSTLSDNTIRGNARNGVTVDVGTGNAVLKNSIFQNGTNGISLQNNGNADQPTPALLTARFDAADGRIVVTGSVAYPDYHGRYQMQVFFSPLGDAPNVQARQFLGSQTDVAAGDFSVTVPGCRGWSATSSPSRPPRHGAAEHLGTVQSGSIGTDADRSQASSLPVKTSWPCPPRGSQCWWRPRRWRWRRRRCRLHDVAGVSTMSAALLHGVRRDVLGSVECVLGVKGHHVLLRFWPAFLRQ